MVERNIEIFNSFVKEFLDKDSTYKQQIENFQNYLKAYSLEDKVFMLTSRNFRPKNLALQIIIPDYL